MNRKKALKKREKMLEKIRKGKSLNVGLGDKGKERDMLKLQQLDQKHVKQEDKISKKGRKKGWSSDRYWEAVGVRKVGEDERGHEELEKGKPRNLKLRRIEKKIKKREDKNVKKYGVARAAKGGKVGDSIKTYSSGGYIEGE